MAEEAKKSTICKGQFTRAEKLLTGAMKDGVAIATFQKRYDDLKQRWNEVQEAHDAYIMLMQVTEDAKMEEEEQ